MALLMAIRRMWGDPVRAILVALDSPFRKARKMFGKVKFGRRRSSDPSSGTGSGRHAMGAPGTVYRPFTRPGDTRHDGTDGTVPVATTLLMNHPVESCPELPEPPLVRLREADPADGPETDPEPPAAAGAASLPGWSEEAA